MTPAATAKAIPTANASESVFSTAATVPAITSVATLSGYATVADFGTTEQDRVSFTVQRKSCLKEFAVVTQVTTV